MHSHDPAAGAAALEAITSPVISTTCTRIPGMRFPDPRVQALLGACCALALRPAGFTSRDLRHHLAPQLGKTPEDMTSGPDQLRPAQAPRPPDQSNASRTAAPTRSPKTACPSPCSSPG